MTEIVPTESELEDINKKAEFAAFVAWSSIPSMLRFPPADQKSGERPTPRQFAQAMGIEDEEILRLVEITTKQQFAAEYRVSPDTLTDWSKKIAKRDGMDDLRMWAQKLSKNMMFAMYNHAIRKGNPLLMKLWFETVEKWTPKLDINATYKGVARVTIQPDHERIAAPQR